jgi:hypothetical protein
VPLEPTTLVVYSRVTVWAGLNMAVTVRGLTSRIAMQAHPAAAPLGIPVNRRER